MICSRNSIVLYLVARLLNGLVLWSATVLALLVPRMTDGNSASFAPELRSYSVSGIFELGVLDHDSVRAFIHLDDARELAGTGKQVDGLRVETIDIFAAPDLVRRWLANSAHADELEVWDWTQQNASYFRAIRLEKTMMALLLSLIIGVAAFNIVATLVMVVTEKRSGIAILRTIGCSRRDVVAIFILQGTLIGWMGAIIGITLGVALALEYRYRCTSSRKSSGVPVHAG